MRISSPPIRAIRWPSGCGRSSPRGAKRSPGFAPIATDTPQAYWSYLRRYPRGPHAGDARRRLAILTAPLEPPPSFAVIDYDVPPPPPDEIVYVDRPVLYVQRSGFRFAPPPPPPLYFLPPPPPDFVVLAPPPPPIGLFILPQPLFVPIPVYVQAAGLCRAAAEQHHLRQHPQHDGHQQRHQPAASAGARRPGPWRRSRRPANAASATSPAGAVAAGAAALPPAVAQRASLIRQENCRCRRAPRSILPSSLPVRRYRRDSKPRRRPPMCPRMRRHLARRCRRPMPCRFPAPRARHPRFRARANPLQAWPIPMRKEPRQIRRRRRRQPR